MGTTTDTKTRLALTPDLTTGDSWPSLIHVQDGEVYRIADSRYLKRLVEQSHYNGEGIGRLFAATEDNDLREVRLVGNGSEGPDDNDYLYWGYDLQEMDGERVAQFTVRIDGRA